MFAKRIQTVLFNYFVFKLLFSDLIRPLIKLSKFRLKKSKFVILVFYQKSSLPSTFHLKQIIIDIISKPMICIWKLDTFFNIYYLFKFLAILCNIFKNNCKEDAVIKPAYDIIHIKLYYNIQVQKQDHKKVAHKDV